jgi:acetyl-CoA C-acetyltransferase
MIAEKWGLDRQALDAFALRSHERAAAAQDAGHFDQEIVPVQGVDGATIALDEGIRRGGTLESLGGLRTVFKEDGRLTAASSSQISDGAAALLLMTPEKASSWGLEPIARVHTAVVAGDDPILSLTALIPATQRALDRSGLSLSDIGTFEVSEAFSSVPGQTVDRQCGSSQQAVHTAAALIQSGQADVVVAGGVEVMSRVPMGATMANREFGRAVPKSYFERYEMTSQFEGAERIADKWGITRADTDAFGLQSQERGARAWAEDRFAGQIAAIDAPDLDEEGKPTGTTHTVTRDEGLRETTLEKLATLKAVAREDGVHTAGTSSQISDGAGAVLLMSREKADALGLKPLAKVVDTCLVGVDPVLMLTGPIDATRRLFERTGMTIGDIDVTEINEAFASVVLSWAREFEPDMETVNPNGGAIALGHPLGGTGSILVTKAVHELVRSDKSTALITMCCGGGIGTGTIIERI